MVDLVTPQEHSSRMGKEEAALAREKQRHYNRTRQADRRLPEPRRPARLAVCIPASSIEASLPDARLPAVKSPPIPGVCVCLCVCVTAGPGGATHQHTDTHTHTTRIACPRSTRRKETCEKTEQEEVEVGARTGTRAGDKSRRGRTVVRVGRRRGVRGELTCSGAAQSAGYRG